MKQQFLLILSNSNYVLLPVILATVILKTSLFLKFRTSSWKYSNIVYFNTGKIVSAKSEQALNQKIIQNCLSYYLVFLLLLEFAICIF